MKGKLIIAGIGLAFSFIVSLVLNAGVFNYEFMTVFGLVNLILAVLGVFVSLILLLARDKKNGLNLLAASGIILLVGAGVCSVYPMHLRMM